MIWLVLTVLCIISGVLAIAISGDSIGCFLSWVFAVIFLFITACFGISGITDYPKLVSSYEEVKVYQTRVIDIRKATYSDNNKSENAIISGSIENVQQSTALSNAISNLSEFLSGTDDGIEVPPVSKSESEVG